MVATPHKLIVELVGHMDAGDRRLWAGDQDTRPLSELGRRQAARMAEALASDPIDGLYSSPALRCRQTLELLADQFGLSIAVLPELCETHGFVSPPGWTNSAKTEMSDSLGGAYAAGRAWAALLQIRDALPNGRVVVCSHGDVLPALIAFLIGSYGLTVPAPHDRRGGWHTITVEGERLSVHHRDILPAFPV